MIFVNMVLWGNLCKQHYLETEFVATLMFTVLLRNQNQLYKVHLSLSASSETEIPLLEYWNFW